MGHPRAAAIRSVEPHAIDLEDLVGPDAPTARLLRLVATGGRSPREASDLVGTELLARFGGLSALSRAAGSELQEELEITASAASARASARAIMAAFELGRRAAWAAEPPTAITDSRDVATWAAPRIGSLVHEELWLLALDGRSRLRAARCVARGGLHGMGVRTADPLRVALRAGASGFVLVHNHPSGDPTPSPEDVTFTARVAAGAAACGVPLLDHVVVTARDYASVPLPSGDPPVGVG